MQGGCQSTCPSVGSQGIHWGGGGGGTNVGQGVIVVSSDDSAPEPVLLTESVDTQFLLDVDDAGVANEEF